MTTIRAKSKKAALDICSKISNKISTRKALSVVEATRQNILEAFPLPSNHEKLFLVATGTTFLSLAGFSPVKFKKMGQLPASTIVILNPFVVPNEILDEISIASSGILSKIVLEAKQSSSVGLFVFVNWADQIETESFFPLVSGATSGSAWETIANNMKLFCMEFAFQTSLDTAFLVELTSSVYLATFKIAKFLVVSEFESPSTTVVLHNVPLSVSAADIKTAFNVFGMVTCVVLKPAGIWQYVIIHFEKLDSSVLMDKDCVRILPLVNQNETILSCNRFKTKLVNLSFGCTAFEISNMISQVGGWSCFISWSPDSGHCFHFALVTFGSQADLNLVVANTGTLRKCCIWWETSNCWYCFQCQETGHLAVNCKVALSLFSKALKVFKPHFVGSLSYAKASAPPVMSEFPPLVASTPPVAIVDPAVGFRLNSLEKQISNLAALVKFIIEPVGSLVVLVSCLLDNNAVKTIQSKKDLFSMKYASNNFANLLVGVSKDIACLKSEVDFGGMNYYDMQITKPSLLSENIVECIIALWQMSGAEIRSSVEFTRLFLNEFIFDSRNLNSVIKKFMS
ncbi:hypothetical protein G9A89_019839 [Geosiphon pyriformis]|nr:hypothetical protein G9A89_019839 [Geosiphon pyriformis]